MSSTMVDDAEASRNIRLTKQLAVAVRSLQWSYAIFWSSSQIQHGVLEWGEGYYNGEIKKRKKKSYEDGIKYGLERSNQLRKLYLCMLEGETRSNTTHDDDNTSGTTTLSPDDLSDEEWYYLVCMSYVFSPAHCLPGKAVATGETIWLCNAQYAETNLFTRSLLARSASIQTVVCFPFLGGVIELGVTELIAENSNLIQHIKDCLLGTSNPQGNSKLEQLKAGNHQVWSKSDDEDLQYKKTLSTVLGFAANRSGRKDYGMKGFASTGSVFLPWKSSSVPSNTNGYQKQSNVLWKVLHDVPLMHSARTNGVSMEYDDHPSYRIKESEKFSVLKSMVPTVNEVDKESILKTTIKYLQDLEARVEELESRVTKTGTETKEKVLSELIEETSETEHAIVRDETKVRVKLKANEVLVEVRCLYRDYIVGDIMEAMSNLNIDALSIRSHTHDGFVVLNLKATFRGAAATSVGMIKRELKRITCGR